MTEQMTEDEMKDHIIALSFWFEARGLDQHQAVAIMGNMISHMITGGMARASFLSCLTASWGMIDGTKH